MTNSEVAKIEPITKILFLVTGPSGSGKSSLLESLIETEGLLREKLTWIVTDTTRDPRVTESHGEDYNFRTVEQFLALRRAGRYFEHNDTEDLGAKGITLYGSPKKKTLRVLRTRNALLELDVHGVYNVAAHPEIQIRGVRVVQIAITADPNLCRSRLLVHGYDDAIVERRVQRGIRDSAYVKHLPYQVTNNGRRADALRDLAEIINYKIHDVPRAPRLVGPLKKEEDKVVA